MKQPHRAQPCPWTLVRAGAILALTALTSCTSARIHLAEFKPLERFRQQSTSPQPPPNKFVIKTTAYCHQESDSKPYGKLTASGTTLRCSGPVRSAAADWSRYPVGTRFRIIGQSQVYEVDDYGSALVGTDTIDIYQPSMRSMRNWGAPVVGIEVIHWGSYAESESILAPRASKSPHVRQMLAGVRAKNHQLEQGLQPVGGTAPHHRPVPAGPRKSA
ncbi:MAG: 3D (Asp-Asp-Asp) domain-containing protein [Verrucomicrobia bacterium]|jgi:3D (Asp-Asp-Asp) domain-containing protein|nr:MAG: 3D (Asp-Asp-Asp) domain-containing protein [Verrucomicrobiota bacterium]